MIMNVYAVLARRYGSQESHSYVVGVFSAEDKAIKAAEREESYRGGKYDCEVIRTPLDHPADNPYDVVRKCRSFVSPSK